MDQATRLRCIVDNSKSKGDDTCRPSYNDREDQRKNRRGIRVISFTSGKGGVGKTNVVANMAMALANMDQRVIILDADLGLANMDVMLGLNPRYTIANVLSGEKRMEEII